MGSKHKDSKRKRDDHDTDTGLELLEEKSKKHKKEKVKDKREKKLLKEAKKFLKQKLKGDSGAEEDAGLASDAQVEAISSEAYYERNAEFTAWLKEDKGIFFIDLPSSEARQLFEEFVGAWNGRKLKRKYYSGIAPAEARRSQHQWGIRGEGVESAKLGIAAAMEEEHEAHALKKDLETIERRRWKTDQKLLVDELLPKGTGRDTLVEKRIARREEARQRGASPDVQVDMYGGGDDSFAAAQAREAQTAGWKAKQHALRHEVGEAKAREAQAKEDERMAQFRALASRGPITIARRQ